LLLIVALILCFTGCDRRERLHLFNWAYYTPESVVELFEKEFNVRVVIDEFTSNEEMFAKMMAGGGGGFDIIFPSEDYTAIMIQRDMLLELDHSMLPNLRYLNPLVVNKMIFDPKLQFSVPYYMGTAGVLVNTLRVPEFERSWRIFEREDLRGRMTMLDDMRETMGAALHYLGYSANTTNHLEIEAARVHIMERWRPNLLRFDAAAFGKIFANEDVWVVHGYPETVFFEVYDNKALFEATYFFVPKEGGTAWIDSMVIPRTARNPELAHKFINFIHRPEIYAMFAEEFWFPTTLNPAAEEFRSGWTMYETEDFINNELKYDLGEALFLYHEAWFQSIIIGR